MIFKLTSLVFLIFCVTEFVAASRRIRLTDPERQPQWMKVQNYSIYQQGPFYGQPEQVHLSYGGICVISSKLFCLPDTAFNLIPEKFQALRAL